MSNLVLKPFQQKAVDRMVHKFAGRALLGDEQGLGKTIQSFAAAMQLVDFSNGPVLVICPAHLKWNWQYEIRKHFNMDGRILSGTKPKRSQAHYLAKAKLIIINYDILFKWSDLLSTLPIQLTIIDECQAIKNPSSKRSKATKKVCRNIAHLLALSGTPLTNRPIELFPILNLLWPHEFPSKFTYAMRYCDPKLKFGRWDVTGASNLDELHVRLKKLGMIRRRKAQVLKQLPAIIRQVVPVQLDAKAMRDYNEVKEQTTQWLRYHATDEDRFKFFTEARLRINRLKVIIGELKLSIIKQWITHYLDANGDKLLVFGIHHNVLRPLHKHFPNSVLINGQVVGEERQRRFRQFNNSPTCRVCFGNLQAAGTGWSCTSASATLHIELGWVPADHIQGEARVHGIKRGTGQQVMAYYLVAQGTIEEKLCRILEDKQAVLDATLDGKPIKESMDVFSIFTQELLKEGRYDRRIAKSNPARR